MNKIENIIKKLIENGPKISIILLIIGIFGSMLILNIGTMLSPDDYSYANVVAGEDLKITSFSEVGNAIKYLYFNWTGRIIPHILIGYFMTTSVVVFKVINTALFVVLLFFINKFITKKTTFITLITAFTFLVYGKMFGEKFLWISGSLNYLWTSVGLIIYLYFIYQYFVEKIELKKWQKISLIVVSPVIGFTHEVTSFVGGAFLILIFLFNFRKLWKNNKQDFIFLTFTCILFGIGSLITIFAPGNIARSTLDINENGTLYACLGNYKDIKWQLIIAIILMILVRFFDEKELFKKEIIYFVIPCLIATIPFSIMGYFPPRCFVPYEALIIITVCANIQVLISKFHVRKWRLILISFLLIEILAARFLPSLYADVRFVLPYKIKFTNQLEEYVEKGEKDVIVSLFLFTDKIHMEDLIIPYNFFMETDCNASPNVFGAIYYKFNRIRAISDDDYLVEIETDIQDNVDYGIIDKNSLELIGIVTGNNTIVYTIPKEKLGEYVVDCRDKDLESHIKSIRVRGLNEEIENVNISNLVSE